jgi:phosphotransferase system enzyme I (PtsI)
LVSVNPGDEELLLLRGQARAFGEERERLGLLRELPSVTLDGKRVELAANIGNVADADAAIRAGAEGVGLFRTEFLFIDRDSMPTEQEQFEAYKQALFAFAPRPVVIRTLDIGGDKEIPYLNMPKEDNPFLGYRAIRLCLDRRDIFRTQLRALLRASVYGNLRIMFPMIATLGELREAKAELVKVRAELAGEGIGVSPTIQVGIMVEIPAAAVDADVLAPECDFFSIGTNDLVQYTMACDRGNPKVAYLSEPFTPAVLKLIRRTIDEGHKQGIWVGMCGEMAGMPEAIPLLLAMGLDEFSMSAGAVPRAKEIIRSLNSEDLIAVWDRVKKMGTAEEIKAHLQSI